MYWTAASKPMIISMNIALPSAMIMFVIIIHISLYSCFKDGLFFSQNLFIPSHCDDNIANQYMLLSASTSLQKRYGIPQVPGAATSTMSIRLSRQLQLMGGSHTSTILWSWICHSLINGQKHKVSLGSSSKRALLVVRRIPYSRLKCST